jgi:hypothetical protein
MTTDGNKNHLHFNRAFELAYWIHVNKEVAFFIAEDALDELPLVLGSQGKNRQPAERLRGFWKGGERARPIRQTIRISETQMLQWLVYKQSDSWERQTERGEGLYLPTEEDMIVRYIEHLVFNALRRGSFYVTLAVGPLLHQFDRRETRLFYDVLTQSDSARMKDMSYIGKQRLELLEKLCRRFDQMIHTVSKSGDEKQFVARPSAEWIIDLVHECLRHFTPWDTKCVVEPGFDLTYIAGFYFSGTDDTDEDPVEMNRIHTLLHPECFARFAEGLSKYIRMLPVDNQDKKCNFDSLDERLTVPQFSNFPVGPSRGDRFQSPELTNEDYVRLQRTIEARSRRRKAFIPRQLCVYVDNTLVKSFQARPRNRVQFLMGPDAGVVEVRGQDANEELTLAILMVRCDEIPAGQAFKDSVADRNDREVEIELTPIRDADGNIEGAHIMVNYTVPGSILSMSWLGRRVWLRFWESLIGKRSADVEPRYEWLAKAAVLATLVALALILVWLWREPSRPGVPDQVAQPPVEETKPVSPATPTPPEQPPAPKIGAPLVARATWSTDPRSALSAIAIEPMRGEHRTADLSSRTELLLSLPVFDNTGRKYSRYRVTIADGAEEVWQRTLQAPHVSLTGSAHILNLLVFPRQLAQQGSYDLRIDGASRRDWESLGHISLNRIER